MLDQLYIGVVRRIHDDPAHTDQQMYSCGLLAPKMRRGGCMDSHYLKPGESWEKSEGWECVKVYGVVGYASFYVHVDWCTKVCDKG